jgi:cyclic pyranopterin phosphate synthase
MEGEDINSKIELDVESIGIVAEAFSRIGVRKFKITGGEPLLRRDIIDIIKAIKTRTSAEDISLTTNGFLLEELAKDLRDAGVDRVNISLHSLNREIFRYITGRDYLEKILRGVELAKK